MGLSGCCELRGQCTSDDTCSDHQADGSTAVSQRYGIFGRYCGHDLALDAQTLGWFRNVCGHSSCCHIASSVAAGHGTLRSRSDQMLHSKILKSDSTSDEASVTEAPSLVAADMRQAAELVGIYEWHESDPSSNAQKCKVTFHSLGAVGLLHTCLLVHCSLYTLS